MISPPSHLRSNLYDLPLEARASAPVADLIGLASGVSHAVPAQPLNPLRPKTANRRVRIWDLNSHLHCSIIGTCLSAGELRRLLVRLKVAGIETADEHELHMLGVLLADRPEQGAKVLQKTLDRRHEAALRRFAKAKGDLAVAALWQQAIGGGDIPGAYWAVLTHPESSDKLVQKAFADVHMLSHLMGATNCADLQRMRRLEDENAMLIDKLERQQRQLRDGFVARDQKIERLTTLLAEKIQSESVRPAADQAEETIALKATIAALNQRLARETARTARLDQREQALNDAEAARRRAEAEREALRAELDAIEQQLGCGRQTMAPDSSAALPALREMTILYVGGRSSQVPQLRSLVERGGGVFIHHDGGVEHSQSLLPALIGRADLTVFPVDCVSHNAVVIAKRTCQQLDRPYVPLRTSSLACLLSCLASRCRAKALDHVS